MKVPLRVVMLTLHRILTIRENVLSQQILCHVYFEKASLVLCYSFSSFLLSAIVFSVRRAQEAHLIKHCIRLA